MYVRWENGYDGAPAIDSKRPYGNSSVYMKFYMAESGIIMSIDPIKELELIAIAEITEELKTKSNKQRKIL